MVVINAAHGVSNAVARTIAANASNVVDAKSTLRVVIRYYATMVVEVANCVAVMVAKMVATAAQQFVMDAETA